MRKVEKTMLSVMQDMINGKENRSTVNIDSTTSMHQNGDQVFVRLFGNLIAIVDSAGNKLTVQNCGLKSATTKSRLNAILYHFDLAGISQANFVWYIGSEEFTGKKVYTLK